MNAYEIRLEVLKLAKDLTEHNFVTHRETIDRNWETAAENARTKAVEIPHHPGYSSLNCADVLKRAESLYRFVESGSEDSSKLDL
jgi:hypothetical protein